jgi:hypothetical protein
MATVASMSISMSTSRRRRGVGGKRGEHPLLEADGWFDRRRQEQQTVSDRCECIDLVLTGRTPRQMGDCRCPVLAAETAGGQLGRDVDQVGAVEPVHRATSTT